MADSLIMRKDVDSLQQPELDALRDAYAKMQGISDNRGWQHWSGLHGYPNYLCWHHFREGNGSQRPYDLFLPWHRAYLQTFQHVVLDQNEAAVLTWWDWTSALSQANGLPAAFTNPGSNPPNSLYSGMVPEVPTQGWPAHATTRSPGDPGQLPTTDDVNALMQLGSYVDFSSQVQDVHDGVHGWVGGDMGMVPLSAYDPIFWSHHCMIDRLWYLWQLQNGMNNIPDDYLRLPLAPFNLTVADVLDIHKLGYDYVATEVSVNA